MRNFPQTIVSQYADSPKLLALLASIDEWISPDALLEEFYDKILNLLTAEGHGLDIWGRIVGVSRTLRVGIGSYFGFGEATDRTGFNQSPFYDGQVTTYAVDLTDEQYRLLIFAKAALNITDSSIPAINRILLNLFLGRGNCYVTDGRNVVGGPYFGFGEAGDRAPFGLGPFGDTYEAALPRSMTLTYVFEFFLEPFEVSIVTQSGVLPKPTGVLAGARYFHGDPAGLDPTPLFLMSDMAGSMWTLRDAG